MMREYKPKLMLNSRVAMRCKAVDNTTLNTTEETLLKVEEAKKQLRHLKGRSKKSILVSFQQGDYNKGLKIYAKQIKKKQKQDKLKQRFHR